jgi:NADH-quinone oxidoreductase subunit G
MINDYLYYYDRTVTMLQACMQKGIYLPRFCYHVKLKLSGNCRLCFIEDSDVVKPIIACSVLINDDMELFTHTQVIFDARECVLELLLINHPLDCPICDQGGECDLQDPYIIFGNITSRYYEKNKRSVYDKDISSTIKLSLNKCINCTRCVRFSQDIAGYYSYSMLGRGEYSEISNYYIYNLSFSELAANVIDLCPVGALTSKAYSFNNRY